MGLRSAGNVGESLLVVHLLEVENSLLGEWDVFSEEVVEVVANTRVPDTSSETNNTKNEKGEDKVLQSSEETLLLGSGRRRRWCSGNLSDNSLGLADIVDSGLVNSLG